MGTKGTPTKCAGPGNRPFSVSPHSKYAYSTLPTSKQSQADTKNHGRPEQAVLLYSASHYSFWRRELGLLEIGPGGFAENFTLAGLDEDTACIGDTYGIGEARIQVTGPRWPCWKIERRWGLEGLTARVAATGRTGWYCRVLREGMIEPGAPVMLIAQPFPEWTVGLANDIGHTRNRNGATARALAECPCSVSGGKT